MSELTWWPAPAKLNLFLHIVGRRPDGYHDLQTIFQLIDRCDRIGLAVRAGRPASSARPACPRSSQRRTSQCAPRARCSSAPGRALGADVHVIKHIPPGGGLGGGSSDAASVLLALNALWRCDLGLPELAQLGVALGADVPLFVHGSSRLGGGSRRAADCHGAAATLVSGDSPRSRREYR